MIILQKNGNIFIGEEPLPQNVLDGALAILANPQAGDTITFNGERWCVSKPLIPLAIEDPHDGDVLTYDGTDKVWKNVAPETPEEPTAETPAET